MRIESDTSPCLVADSRASTLESSGATLPIATSTVDCIESPFAVTGWIDQTLNRVAIQIASPLPTTAKVGDHAIVLSGPQVIQKRHLTHSLRRRVREGAHGRAGVC